MGRVAGARLLALVHVGGGGVLHVDGDAVPLAPAAAHGDDPARGARALDAEHLRLGVAADRALALRVLRYQGYGILKEDTRDVVSYIQEGPRDE